MNIKDDVIQYNKLELENIKLKFQLAFIESKNKRLKKQLKKLIKRIMTPKQEKIAVETFAIICSFIVAIAIVLIIKSIVL